MSAPASELGIVNEIGQDWITSNVDRPPACTIRIDVYRKLYLTVDSIRIGPTQVVDRFARADDARSAYEALVRKGLIVSMEYPDSLRIDM